MRLEYSEIEEKRLRLTEIEALLENELYADETEATDLVSEMIAIENELKKINKKSN